MATFCKKRVGALAFLVPIPSHKGMGKVPKSNLTSLGTKDSVELQITHTQIDTNQNIVNSYTYMSKLKHAIISGLSIIVYICLGFKPPHPQFFCFFVEMVVE